MKKRILALAVALVMAVGLGSASPPAAAADFYDGEKAVAYAAAHWNDGKGFCAEFASDCIKTAGLTSWSTSSTKLFHMLCKEVAAGSQIATVQLLTVTDRRIKPADNEGKLSKGDIVFFQCDRCAHCMHTLIVSDVSGENAKCYQHNPRVNNRDIKIDPCYQCGREYSRIIAIHFGSDPTAQALGQAASVPPGTGRAPVKGEAIACLDGIAYVGDRAALTMTQEQAQTLADRIAAYAADPAQTAVYAALFDTGWGVPGLLLAKGYGPTGGAGRFASGEAALWSFQDGTLVPFTPAQPGDAVTLYPAYVGVASAGADGQQTERYYARGYGNLYPDHACALTAVLNDGCLLYGANGWGVTETRYQELTAAYQGSGGAVSAGPDGTGYAIGNMTPAAQMTAALEDYGTILTTSAAYPARQTVSVNGRETELFCYALRDEQGNAANYVRLRDLASALNGTSAQFAVGYYGMVNIATGWPYTPDGDRSAAPFDGEQRCRRVDQTTNVDGTLVTLSAFTLTDETGGGYTYYKLRDLGEALGCAVGWSAETGITIETE